MKKYILCTVVNYMQIVIYCCVRLKEQRDETEKAHQDELELQQKLSLELKTKLNSAESQVSAKQQQVSKHNNQK